MVALGLHQVYMSLLEALERLLDSSEQAEQLLFVGQCLLQLPILLSISLLCCLNLFRMLIDGGRGGLRKHGLARF